MKNYACFVVIDSAEQKLAYVYFEEESGRRSAGKLLSKDGRKLIPGWTVWGNEISRDQFVAAEVTL